MTTTLEQPANAVDPAESVTPELDPPSVQGWHPNVDAEVYHLWKGASSTRLNKMIAESPAHVRHDLLHPEPPTPAKRLGLVTHDCLLLPDRFWGERYVVAERCCATKADKRPCDNEGKYLVGGKWYCGVHVKKDRCKAVLEAMVSQHGQDGFVLHAVSDFGSHYMSHQDGRRVRIADHAPNARTRAWMLRENVADVRVDVPPYGADDRRSTVSAEDFQKCLAMRDSALAHPKAADLLCGDGECELSGTWVDEATEQVCRLRVDKFYTQRTDILVDVKTTESAHPGEFLKSILKYGYHRQAAFYMHGAAKLGRPAEAFVIIAVETAAPHAVGVYRVDDDLLSVGWDQVRPIIDLYSQCERSGVWPGYSDKIVTLSKPAWM